MKTAISQFCRDYEVELTSLEKSLRNAVACIRDEDHNNALTHCLAGLNDVNHRLQSLNEKIQNQQAYLLIFGPLKSGKSTLINAISGEYVSEVTAMPAYPGLVYVKHGEKQEFSVLRYDGEENRLSDAGQVQVMISENHSQLAHHLAEAEEEGRSFDPALDFPKAIRRVNITLPVPNLADASTVLVDTPGLYSRMKFGYDLMTREFRNAAACAVFVVKTDNLFLEQVFDEFNELLDLFSRVFLVVNLDSRKQDLRPDGTLGPSLEKEDPAKIIEAFESLSMSSPLRRAFRDGRLGIYPIDLLSAASNSLAPAETSSEGDEPVKPEVESESGLSSESSVFERDGGEVVPVEPEEASSQSAAELGESADSGEDSPEESSSAGDSTPEGQDALASQISESLTGIEPDAASGDTTAVERLSERSLKFSFEEFLSDLTEYLNSTEYLAEFERDSLRQGRTLGDEVAGHCGPAKILEFTRYDEALEKEQGLLNERQQAARVLTNEDIQTAFASLVKDNEDQAKQLQNKVIANLRKSVRDGLDGWFGSDESLRDLQERYWKPALKDASARIAKETVDRIQGYIDRIHGGASLSPEAVSAVTKLELTLDELAGGADLPIDEATLAPVEGVKVFGESIAVKKTFLDWILFRNKATVRLKLFGDPDHLDKSIDPVVKQKRLMVADQPGIDRIIEDHIDSKIPGLAGKLAAGLLEGYITRFEKGLATLVSGVSDSLQSQLDVIDSKRGANKRVLSAIENLRSAAATFETTLDALTETYIKPEPEPEPEPEREVEFEAMTDLHADDEVDSVDEEMAIRRLDGAGEHESEEASSEEECDADGVDPGAGLTLAGLADEIVTETEESEVDCVEEASSDLAPSSESVPEPAGSAEDDSEDRERPPNLSV